MFVELCLWWVDYEFCVQNVNVDYRNINSSELYEVELNKNDIFREFCKVYELKFKWCVSDSLINLR